MKSNGLFSNLGGMTIFATVCAMAVSPLAASAETWYWVGANKDKDGAQWQGLNNWTNENGTVGDPSRGDDVVFNDSNANSAYLNCKSSGEDTGNYPYTTRVPLNSIIFEVNKGTSQGNFALIGGGEGLKVIPAGYNQSHWGGILLEGEGDVPVDIVEASSVFSCQMRMIARQDPAGACNPALVKKGLGELRCFVQAGTRNYTIPLTKIQQGKIDITVGKQLTNCEFRFDGNDESARLSFGFTKSYLLNLQLGTGCAITESDDVANSAHGITSPYDLQLQFTGEPGVNPMTFSGQFYGGAGLLWNPSSAGYAFIYSNTVSATTGRIDVATGTFKLVNGASFTSLSGLSVGAAGTLDVESGSGANFHSETFDILTGGKLRLGAGVVVTVGTATLDTLPVKAGIYAASAGEGLKAADWIEGAGTVVVETGDVDSVKWIGAGTDTYIATAGNWSPYMPDLAAGDSFVLFAEGGSSANLTRDANFAGISLKGGFSFVGGGTLGVGGLGVSTLDVSSPVAYNFDCPVEIVEGQSWTVGTNNTFNVSEGLSGSGSLVVVGDGVFNVGGVSTLAGPVNIGSKATIGGVNVLGVAGAASRVRNDSGAICFSSATNDASVTFYNVGADNESNIIRFVGDNVFNGAVTNTSITLNTVNGATIDFKQRYRGNVINFTGDGNVVFRERLDLSGSTGTWYVRNNAQSVVIDFYAANNYVSGTFWCELFSGTVRCHVPYALQANGGTGDASGRRIHMSSPAVIDLGGYDQSLDGLASNGGGTITSEDPAFFHWKVINPYNGSNAPGNEFRTNNVVFAGMAGLSYDGTMTNRLGGVSTTAGTLQVTKGKLIILPQASWTNCANVVVSNGILSVENAQAFNKKLIMNIFNDGKVGLDFDGVLKCDELYIDGVRMGGGFYRSAEGTGLGRVNEHFLGRGTFRVQPRGTRISLR